MRKTLLVLTLACIFTLINAVAALAYNPGQRTIQLLGSTLNSDRQPVHLVVTQKIDMAEILTPEAYNKLTQAQKVRYSRTEYNEANGINAERNTMTDGEGKVLSDTNTFIKGGYWYTVDYVNKTYDRLPELPGMSMPFAETLISWFSVKPEAGVDAVTGYEYDKMTKGSNSLYFYYEKGTANWKGYEVSYLPMFQVEELSNNVNVEAAFALPPADFKQKPNEGMRNFANRLMGGGKK